MRTRERDETLRKKILREIADIEAFTAGMTLEGFCAARIAQKAVMMSLMNIGELSKSFSDAYLAQTAMIPWKAIRGLRNVAAHQYDEIKLPNIWVTVCEDIPTLKRNLQLYTPIER